jgi:hypothetical protein
LRALFIRHKGSAGLDVIDGNVLRLRGHEHLAQRVYIQEGLAAADVHGGRAQRFDAGEDLRGQLRGDIIGFPIRGTVIEAVTAPRLAAVVHHQAARGQFEDARHMSRSNSVKLVFIYMFCDRIMLLRLFL